MQNHYPLNSEISMITPIPQGQNPAPQQTSAIVYPQLPNCQMGQPLPNQNFQISQPVPVAAPQYNYGVAANQNISQYFYHYPTSRYPQILTCQMCKRQVQSVVNYEAGNGAYVVGGLLAAVGLWLGCCLIPCMMTDCKDAIHFCPQCSANIGRKKFLFE